MNDTFTYFQKKDVLFFLFREKQGFLAPVLLMAGSLLISRML